MKTLGMDNLFSAARLLLKIGVRDEIIETVKRAQESKVQRIQIDMGFDLFCGILEKAVHENAEQEIYIWIADLFECDPNEVRRMKPIECFNKLEQAASFEEWKDFFGRVRRLIMKK